MKKSISVLTVFFVLLNFGLFCGDGSGGKAGSGTAEFLNAEFEDVDLIRSDEVRTFKGESLFEYINGGAEIYHLYKFTEVSTASYKSGESEIILDIYEFENADNAFGLFTSIKPPGLGDLRLGVEGFSTENSVDFVKGKYIVHIVGYDESKETKSAINNLAVKLDGIVPGSSERPAAFNRFPSENVVLGSEHIYAKAFLGRIYLTDVYSLQYGSDDNIYTLFLSSDSIGEKYLQWVEGDRSLQDNSYNSRDFPFDDGRSFALNDDYRGRIIAGLINGRLVGILNYKESHRAFFAQWLESIN